MLPIDMVTKENERLSKELTEWSFLDAPMN